MRTGISRLLYFIIKGGNRRHIIKDLFQPNTDLFSTRAFIWVHFKTVHYFSQQIFSLFLYLKNALHNLVIELCSAPFFFEKHCTIIYQIHAQFRSYWIINFLQKCKNTILLLKRALGIPHVNRIGFFCYLCQ